MSVVAHSPFPGSKRLFEDDIDCEQVDTPHSAAVKRARCCGSPAAGLQHAFRSTSTTSAPASLHPATLQALRALFAHMDDQTLTSVLVECGSDIDAAIRRLNELRLNAELAASAATPSPAQLAADADTSKRSTQQKPQQPIAQQQQQQQQQPPSQQQQQQQQQQLEAPVDHMPRAAPPAPRGPQTADEWTAALVAEMAAARDIEDAKARAARALSAFEAFVSERAAKAGGGGMSRSRFDELQRENAILKRAVQIQNARMQESAGRDAELAALKAAVAQYQERLRSLELSNYSLALHLSKATDGGPVLPSNRRPDVF